MEEVLYPYQPIRVLKYDKQKSMAMDWRKGKQERKTVFDLEIH